MNCRLGFYHKYWAFWVLGFILCGLFCDKSVQIVHAEETRFDVEVLELHLMVYRRHPEDLISAFMQLYLLLQIDGIQTSCGEEADVEDEYLKSKSTPQHNGDTLRDVRDGRLVRSIEASQMVDDILQQRWHR